MLFFKMILDVIPQVSLQVDKRKEYKMLQAKRKNFFGIVNHIEEKTFVVVAAANEFIETGIKRMGNIIKSFTKTKLSPQSSVSLYTDRMRSTSTYSHSNRFPKYQLAQKLNLKNRI